MTERTVVLANVADIRGVSALAAQLRELAATPEPVQVDASGLQRVDAAILQVLLAFVRERRPQGLAIHWRASTPLTEGARLLGLSGALELEPSPVSESS